MAAGLKEAFKKAAAAAFQAAGNVKETISYRSKQDDNPTFNPSTNVVSDPYTLYENLEVILTQYSVREVDGDSIQLTDLKCMLLCDDIEFIPKAHDVIVRIETHNDGSSKDVVWEILTLQKDAADAVWTFQLRRPS